jgi:hypothetical protein
MRLTVWRQATTGDRDSLYSTANKICEWINFKEEYDKHFKISMFRICKETPFLMYADNNSLKNSLIHRS